MSDCSKGWKDSFEGDSNAIVSAAHAKVRGRNICVSVFVSGRFSTFFFMVIGAGTYNTFCNKEMQKDPTPFRDRSVDSKSSALVRLNPVFKRFAWEIP